MKTFIFATCISLTLSATAALSLEPGDPAQAWHRASDTEKAVWTARVASSSRSNIDRTVLLARIISCLNDATELGDVKGVSLVDVSVVCIAGIDRGAK